MSTKTVCDVCGEEIKGDGYRIRLEVGTYRPVVEKVWDVHSECIENFEVDKKTIVYEQKKLKSTKVEAFINVMDALHHKKNEKYIVGYIGTGRQEEWK